MSTKTIYSHYFLENNIPVIYAMTVTANAYYIKSEPYKDYPQRK